MLAVVEVQPEPLLGHELVAVASCGERSGRPAMSAEAEHLVTHYDKAAVAVRELARQLVEISGYPGPVLEDAEPPGRSAGIPWQQADITRAAADIGWSPERDLRTSLADMWAAL